MKNVFQIIAILTLVIFSQACSPLKSSIATSSSTAESPSIGDQAGAKYKSATLAWAATPGQQVGFKIEKSIDGGAYTLEQTVPDNTFSAVIQNLAAGKTYNFRIRAYNLAGESVNTSVVTLKN